MATANLPIISGELSADIGMITGEIRRVAQVFNDVKKRGNKVEEEAQKAKEELEKNYKLLNERKIGQQFFMQRTRDRLSEVIARLQIFATTDRTFELEIEKARRLIAQIKRLFPFAKDKIIPYLHPVDLADSQLKTAEFYIERRVNGCKYNVKSRLTPILTNFNTYPPVTMEAQARMAYDWTWHTAEDLNELTRLAMINVLKAYKIVRQEYPLLRKELAGLADPTRQRRRMLA